MRCLLKFSFLHPDSNLLTRSLCFAESQGIHCEQWSQAILVQEDQLAKGEEGAGVLCHVRFFATPWTAACQPPLSMAFSRQEEWSGLPFPPLGIFPTQGLNPRLPWLLHWQAPTEPRGKHMCRRCW